jgi:hypothetical protein
MGAADQLQRQQHQSSPKTGGPSMSLLIFALIVTLVVVLLVWAVDQVPAPPPVGAVLKVAIILIGVLIIVQRAGLA